MIWTDLGECTVVAAHPYLEGRLIRRICPHAGHIIIGAGINSNQPTDYPTPIVSWNTATNQYETHNPTGPGTNGYQWYNNSIANIRVYNGVAYLIGEDPQPHPVYNLNNNQGPDYVAFDGSTWVSHDSTPPLALHLYDMVQFAGALFLVGTKTSDGYVYKSTDGGATWTEPWFQPNGGGTRYYFAVVQGGTLYVQSNNGITTSWKTTTGGEGPLNWSTGPDLVRAAEGNWGWYSVVLSGNGHALYGASAVVVEGGYAGPIRLLKFDGTSAEYILGGSQTFRDWFNAPDGYVYLLRTNQTIIKTNNGIDFIDVLSDAPSLGRSICVDTDGSIYVGTTDSHLHKWSDGTDSGGSPPMATVVLNAQVGSELPNEGIQDALNTVLTGGTYVTIVYNDGANTFTFDLSTEALMDYLGANFLTAGTGISLTYNDVSNTLTIAATGSGGMTNPMTTANDIILGGASGTPGRLAKGSDSQVLTVDPTSHNVIWASPTGGLTNPMTTAEDLIVGGASGAPARLAKGADGTVLTVDPTTHALTWTTPSGGGSALTINNEGTPLATAATSIDFVGFGVQVSGTGAAKTVRVGSPLVVPWISGRWYDWGSSFSWSGPSSSVAVAANTFYASPIYVPMPVTGTTVSIDQVAINIGTGAAGNARIGIYTFTDAFTPNNLVKDCGTVSTSGTGVVSIDISGAPAVLDGGRWYFTAIVFDAAPSVFMYSNTMTSYAGGRTAISSTTKWAGVSRTFTYAALPDPYGGTPSNSANAIQVGLRVV